MSVESGARGLMQSEAVFQHVRALPELLCALMAECPDMEIAAVCASAKPRPGEDSYMPVFRVGECFARSLAASHRVPFFETTHQHGHIRAARVGTSLSMDEPFLMLHLSGGTTEALHVQGDQIRLAGGTLDISAGQLIDRIGVAMGLPFPAGPHLEALAALGTCKSRLAVSLKELDCHFSGAEAQALRWLASGELTHEDIAAEVFGCVARTVARLIHSACERLNLSDALLGGGVASSRLIRAELERRVPLRNRHIALHFARPDLASDNAVGVAMIGEERAEREEDATRGTLSP